MENILIHMVMSMKDNFHKIRDMVKVFIIAKMETIMKGIGQIIREMGME
jgi:hypothetical protein